MKICVVHKNGRQEMLTVVGPLSITESRLKDGMNHFRDATGNDYWFNVSDGTYDGWSRDTTIEQVQGRRETVKSIVP